jgi:hypothetical protein
MRVRTLVVVFALVGSVAFARIGDSTRACERRYGSPVRASDTGSLVTYRSGRLSIVVHFSGGVADMVSYHKLPSGQGDPAPPFGREEVTELLDQNSGGGSWLDASSTTDATVWRTEDGTLRAVLDLTTNHLMVFTEVFAATG